MFHHVFRPYALAFAGLILALRFAVPVSAALSGFLTGIVTLAGAPAGGVAVTAAGNTITQRTTTDAGGHFTFALPPGTYDVAADAGERHGSVRVDLGSSGASLSVPLETKDLKQIGRVAIARSSPTGGSGTDTTLNGVFLTRSPGNGSFPELLVQLPGAARGANGVVHLNGDHGDINYIVDGIPIPQELNRNIGTEFDPNDVAFADVIEGAYPAQFGERFGGVVNITTRSGSGPAGFNGDIRGGSYNDGDATIGYHAPLGPGGGLAVAVRNGRSTRGLDGPDFDSPHNAFSDSNGLVHATLPLDAYDSLNATLTHNYSSYQIPNYVSSGEPAATNDNETQEDSFATFQFRHSFGDRGLLTFGPALKISRIRDFGDPLNDFAFGKALNLRAGGGTTDCATALQSGNFGPTTCGYSLTADRTAADYRFQTDYAQRTGVHEVRTGLAYDFTDVGKRYGVTLQPGNFLAPLKTPSTPHAAYTVVDSSSNAGNTYETYAQDSWRLGSAWRADYGVRYDHFSISSASFASEYTQFSPRFKITRLFGQRADAYAYFGRFFTPFSFENVDPAAAQELNLPNQPRVAQFDLRPERDTQLEVGGHVPLGRGSLGLRLWQKNANDLIDDTQVGVTLLHQDINYRLGRLSSESAFYQESLERNGRFYASVTHTVSLNAGCETQLLAPCFGAPTGYTPADHDQRWDVTGGVLLNDRRDGWFAFDGEYGSGLSSAACPDGTLGYCKRTPHLTFDVEKGIGIGGAIAFTLRIRNLLNDRYFVTLANAQGDHYAPPRTFDFGVRFGR